MDRIAVPDNQIIPMDEVAPDIRGLRIAFVNIFGVIHSNGSWTLIDAALPFTASRIRNWAESFSKTPPNAIVLTHGHFDHVSVARELADSWNVPIYAHSLEAPYLTGKMQYSALRIWAQAAGPCPYFLPCIREARLISGNACDCSTTVE
jgi:glyoxylase-like metal-dependent hydrolase (beta-lactamase superfamily II)